MPTAKKTADEEAPAQEDPSPPVESAVCALCGKPATRVSASEAYSAAYYCDEHGSEEPLKKIGG